MKIADMHCDTIERLYRQNGCSHQDGLFENTLHVDLKKLAKGDYMLQNFAMFICRDDTDDQFLTAMELIDRYYQELEKNKEYIAPVFRFQDIAERQAEGKLSALLTIEEGGAIRGDRSCLRNFYRLGVRMMTLTWNYENEIGSPNLRLNAKGIPLFHERNQKGLTEFGIEAIKEMEHLGMIVDVSHLSDGGFWDVVRNTKKPFAASHSNAASICNVSRNMTDDMIKALGERGGVMGLNFCEDFLCESNQRDSGQLIEAMVRHVSHIVNIGGIELCGFGTDFDGIPGNRDIRDASQMQKLLHELQKKGFHERELEKICYKNVLRLYRDCL